MNNLAANILDTLQEEKRWKAEIYVNGVGFNSDPHANQTEQIVDLIAYMDVVQSKGSHNYDETFPFGSSLRFMKFKSSTDENAIKVYIKECERRSGTILTVGKSVHDGKSERLISITFECDKHRITTASPKHFNAGFMQQQGTIIQQDHLHSSTKGNSRSAHNILSQTAHTLINPQNTRVLKKKRKANQKNKETTTRALCQETICPLHFTIFLYKQDEQWYLSNLRRKFTGNDINIQNGYHYHHIRVFHHETYKNDLSEDILTHIRSLHQLHIPSGQIKRIVCHQYGISVSDSTLRSIMNDTINSLLDDIVSNPSMLGPAKRMIELLKLDDNLSYVYVSHSVACGFMSFAKCNKESTSCTQSHTDVGVTNSDIKKWREDLKVIDDEILISFFSAMTRKSGMFY